MSSDQNLSEPAVAVLLAVAIVLPPVGMVVGIMGIRRGARERSRHAGRWYGAITIVALVQMAAVIGTALVGSGARALVYAVLAGIVAFAACLWITRSWRDGSTSPAGVAANAQAKP